MPGEDEGLLRKELGITEEELGMTQDEYDKLVIEGAVRSDPFYIDYNDPAQTRQPDRVTPKEDWGGIPVFAEEPLTHPVTTVFTGYTGTGSCNAQMQCLIGMQRLQRYYLEIMDKKDVPYNFVIGGTGVVYEGRGWNNRPELPEKFKSFQDNSIYIAYLGSTETFKTFEMMEALKQVIAIGMDRKYLANKILHYCMSVALHKS